MLNQIDIFTSDKVNEVNGWQNKPITWEEFIKILKTPEIKSYSMSYYKELKAKKFSTDKEVKMKAISELALIKDSGAFVGGRFRSTRRVNSEVEYRSLINLDLDDCDDSIWDILKEIKYECFWHTTHSHTVESPKVRIFIPLERVIETKDEFTIITQEFVKSLGFEWVYKQEKNSSGKTISKRLLSYKKRCYLDPCSYKIAQPMFYPSVPEDYAPYFKCEHIQGQTMNPYKYYKNVQENIKNISENNKQELKERLHKDGLNLSVFKGVKGIYELKDVIGKFCRKYTITEVIDEYLSDVYIKSSSKYVYSFKEGSGLNGLKIYPDDRGNDDTFAYTFHGSDPMNDGHVHNAFDILKIHKFSDEMKEGETEEQYEKRRVINTIKFCKKVLGITDKYIIETREDHEATYHYLDEETGLVKLDIGALVDHLEEELDHTMFNTCGGFYVYDDGAYSYKTKNNICKIIENHLHKDHRWNQIVQEVYNRLCRNEKELEILNNKNNVIIFNNIAIEFNMETGEPSIIEKSPTHLTTFKIKHDYNPKIKCSKWEKTLNELLPKDQIKLLQEIIGYMLIPDNTAKRFFTLYGKGDTGKSLILKVIYKMLGNDVISTVSLQRLSNPNSRFDTSELHGKLANIVGDLSPKALPDSSVIKQLTGDDPINAERKNQGQFTFKNLARMIFGMNELPNCYTDKTDAFYRRFVIIPFENVIPTEKQNKYLADEIDMVGVINWALEGLQRLIKNKLIFSTTSVNTDLLQQYKEDNNNVIQFIKENTVKSNGIDVKGIELYDFYKTFCKENSYTPLGRNKFNNEVKKLDIEYSENCTDEHKKRFRGFKNISIKEESKNDYLHLVHSTFN